MIKVEEIHDNYFIEVVDSGLRDGPISGLAKKMEVGISQCLNYYIFLNKHGVVNFLNKNKYVSGTKIFANKEEKKFSIINFIVLLKIANRNHVELNLVRLYYFNPIIFLTFSILTIFPLLTREDLRSLVLINIINFLFVSSVLFHELGHYYAAILLHAQTRIKICGLAISLLYSFDDSSSDLKSIIVSAAGFFIHFLFLVLAFNLREKFNSIYLSCLLNFFIILQIVLSASILPFFRDGKNIVCAIANIINRKESNCEKNVK